MFKKIKAMIKPLNLNEVREALGKLGIEGVTISKCKNFAPREGPAMIFRGRKQATDFLSEIKLEMVVEQEMAGKVIEIIQKAERTTKGGDCLISILPIEEVIPLETTEPVGIPHLGAGT